MRIMSPTTNTSGWPGSVQSASRLTCPERWASPPVRCASNPPRAMPATPAAHTLAVEATTLGLTVDS